MQIACGTDIIEINRIKESIENLGNKFINKIFTQNEIKYCESKKKMKYQHYAARFAAKEATYKAFSKVLKEKNDIKWNDIEIVNDKEGKPNIFFLNKSYEEMLDIDISLSHCKEYATANVVVIIK